MNHILAKAGILFFASYLMTYAGKLTRFNLAQVFPLLVILFAILLFLYADAFAHWLTKNYSNTQQQPAMPLPAIFRLAFVFAGLIITSKAFDGLRFIFEYYGGKRYTLVPEVKDIPALILLAWCIFLICGAPKLVSWQVRKTQQFLNRIGEVKNES